VRLRRTHSLAALEFCSSQNYLWPMSELLIRSTRSIRSEFNIPWGAGSATARSGGQFAMKVWCGPNFSPCMEAAYKASKLMAAPNTAVANLQPRANQPPRWNAAPGQELLIIRRNHDLGEVSLDPVRWGLIPHWCKDPLGGRKPINAKCETVRDLPTFREAYRRRRCIVPVDGFFEWKAIKGQKAKQPYAIAMQYGTPFCQACGRTGRSQAQANGCAPLQSSPLMQTSSSPRFTTECP
jgi:SOS response associated peptidase (SRAP)